MLKIEKVKLSEKAVHHLRAQKLVHLTLKHIETVLDILDDFVSFPSHSFRPLLKQVEVVVIGKDPFGQLALPRH
jgi:hypothetical protein